MGLLTQLGVMLFLLGVLGLVCGRTAERRHFRRLREREAELADMPVTNLKTFPGGAEPTAHACLVLGECVIASDYLKSFLARWRNIFGGEMRSFVTLMERARREATVRMLQDARRRGYNAVCNVRLRTATVGSATRRGGAAMVEMIATGTAYNVPRGPADGTSA